MPLASQVDPGRKLFVVTPSDTTVIAARGLWVGVGGDVTVVAADDVDPVTLPNVPSGCHLPYAVKQVMLTNTTASGIRGVR